MQNYLTTDNIISKNLKVSGSNNITVVEEPLEEPKFYKVTRPMCSPLVQPAKLADAFADIPHLWGAPDTRPERLKAFVGGNLTAAKFERLAKYCRWVSRT